MDLTILSFLNDFDYTKLNHTRYDDIVNNDVDLVNKFTIINLFFININTNKLDYCQNIIDIITDVFVNNFKHKKINYMKYLNIINNYDKNLVCLLNKKKLLIFEFSNYSIFHYFYYDYYYRYNIIKICNSNNKTVILDCYENKPMIIFNKITQNIHNIHTKYVRICYKSKCAKYFKIKQKMSLDLSEKKKIIFII